MGQDIFLSYRRSDQAIARALVEQLEARGVSVWWDQKIEGGEDWRDAIVAGLEGAHTLVILFSEECNESKQLKKELAIADTLDKLVIPVLIEDTQPKGHYLYELAARNWIQVFPHPETKAAELAERLARELGLSGAQVAPAEAPQPMIAPAAPAADSFPAAAEPTRPDAGLAVAPPQPAAPVAPALQPAATKSTEEIVKEKVRAQREATSKLKNLRDFMPLRWIDLIPLSLIAGVTYFFVEDEWYVGILLEWIGVGMIIAAIALGAYGAIAFPIRYYLRKRRLWRTAMMQALNSLVSIVLFAAGLFIWWEGDASSALEESVLFIPPVFITLTIIAVIIYGILNGQRALRSFRKNVEVL